MSVRQWETVSATVYIFTSTTRLALMRTTGSQLPIAWSHLVGKKELSLWIWWKGVALQSMKVEKHKQNKAIIGPAAWNHALAKLKQSILHQLDYNLLLKLFSPLLFPFLCLCEVQLNTSLWPARSFTQHRYWYKRSERLRGGERVHEGYRVFIYYPSPILMQPLCSKKRLLIYSFYEAFEKRWHCKRVGLSD